MCVGNGEMPEVLMCGSGVGLRKADLTRPGARGPGQHPRVNQ